MCNLLGFSTFIKLCNITPSNLRIFLLLPKEIPGPIAVTPHYPLSWPAHPEGPQQSHGCLQLGALTWMMSVEGILAGHVLHLLHMAATSILQICISSPHLLPISLSKKKYPLISFCNHLNVPQKDHKFNVSLTELIFSSSSTCFQS